MKIGLTGSMASGKSTVSKLLFERGYYIIDADKISREAVDDPHVKAKLVDAFGSCILNSDGTLNRPATASAAFSSVENTEKLNSIVHPYVIERMIELSCSDEANKSRGVVFDVPLLFESGFQKHCDRIITVAADDEIRYLRIMLRDGLTREQAAARINKQMPQCEKIALSDAVIMNNGTRSELFDALKRALVRIGAEEGNE